MRQRANRVFAHVQFVCDGQPTGFGYDQVGFDVRQALQGLQQTHAVNCAGRAGDGDDQALRMHWLGWLCGQRIHADGRSGLGFGFVNELLQLTRLKHFRHDVRAADEFAFDVQLRNRWPL